jgi:hypothetical protein
MKERSAEAWRTKKDSSKKIQVSSKNYKKKLIFTTPSNFAKNGLNNVNG